jgi:hypothetical protein
VKGSVRRAYGADAAFDELGIHLTDVLKSDHTKHMRAPRWIQTAFCTWCGSAWLSAVIGAPHVDKIRPTTINAVRQLGCELIEDT